MIRSLAVPGSLVLCGMRPVLTSRCHFCAAKLFPGQQHDRADCRAGQVRSGLPAGGRWIRTVGPPLSKEVNPFREREPSWRRQSPSRSGSLSSGYRRRATANPTRPAPRLLPARHRAVRRAGCRRLFSPVSRSVGRSAHRPRDDRPGRGRVRPGNQRAAAARRDACQTALGDVEPLAVAPRPTSKGAWRRNPPQTSPTTTACATPTHHWRTGGIFWTPMALRSWCAYQGA